MPYLFAKKVISKKTIAKTTSYTQTQSHFQLFLDYLSLTR